MKLFTVLAPVSPGADNQGRTIVEGALFCLPCDRGYKQPFFETGGKLRVRESIFKQGHDIALDCSEEFFKTVLDNPDKFVRPDPSAPSSVRLLEAAVEISGRRGNTEPLLRLTESKRESDLALVLVEKRYGTQFDVNEGIEQENILGEIARSPERPPNWVAFVMRPNEGLVVKYTVKAYCAPPFRLFGGKRELQSSYDVKTDCFFYDGNRVRTAESEEQLNQLQAFHKVTYSEPRVID
ncbi:MAG: hypothetical protein K2X81_02155 [Candidatus Obscuribacterales bacterium]|nr:hypothetical protein [Candidatus Obscuribacterales bacterium]